MTLPSGNVVRLRPVDMSVMMLEGRIPDLLSPLAAKSLFLGIEEDDMLNLEDAEAFEKVKEIAPDMLKLYNIVTKAAFLEPRIVENPEGDDEISIEDVDAADKAAVFAYTSQGAAALKFFRDQQNADVEPTHDGAGIRPEAEPDGDDKQPVDSVPV